MRDHGDFVHSDNQKIIYATGLVVWEDIKYCSSSNWNTEEILFKPSVTQFEYYL